MSAHELMSLLGQESLATLYMTFVGTLVAYLIGLPVGVSLVVTGPNGIKPRPVYNKVMGFIVNVIRSVPFLILMIALIPYIRKVIGTGIGPRAITAALIIAAAPFVARLVEQSLLEDQRSRSHDDKHPRVFSDGRNTRRRRIRRHSHQIRTLPFPANHHVDNDTGADSDGAGTAGDRHTHSGKKRQPHQLVNTPQRVLNS